MEQIYREIDEELKLVCAMAIKRMSSRNYNPHMSFEQAVNYAYSVLDVAAELQQKRRDKAIDLESKRNQYELGLEVKAELVETDLIEPPVIQVGKPHGHKSATADGEGLVNGGR